MRLSIIIPVLNSHEMVRRQLLHISKLNIPFKYEIIIVDDGSEVPLHTVKTPQSLPVRFIQTYDTRPWTWALARNRGAKEAQGEYLLMYDVDHYFNQDTIDIFKDFTGCKIQFLREFGVLLEDGTTTQEIDVLKDYGFPEERYGSRRLKLSPLPNNFIMKRSVFMDIGGYREDLVERTYPQGEDRMFKKVWYNWERKTGQKCHWQRPTIYMIPNGYLLGDVDADPKGLFHTLTRKTRRNQKYVRV